MSAVLIVDDSLTVRMDLAEAFAEAGFQTELRADLAGAREALERRSFGLVVLDVLLPDGDGLELLVELKRSSRHGRTPVVLLSTEAEVQHRVRGLHTGADEYVGKPYDPAHVIARARQLVRRTEVLRARDATSSPVLLVGEGSGVEALRSAIEQAGMSVEEAGSGEDGLRAAAEGRPAAVVVACGPALDGPTFARQLRADAVLRALPCLLALARGGTEVEGLEAGADACVGEADGIPALLARLKVLVRSAPAAFAAPGDGMFAPRRILAIARPEAVLEVVEALREDGYDVVLAPSLGEAVELLAVDAVDSILVEVVSLAAALETCAALRGDPAHRDVPVLLLSASDDPEAKLRGLRAGADEWISAATGLEVLRARVRAQVRRKAMADESRSREAYARNAAILETISDAFFAVDRDWRFVYANGPLERAIGVSRQDLLGKRMGLRATELAGGAIEAELKQAARQRSPATVEVQLAGERWFEVRAFPHDDGLSVYLRDVTERRRTQEVQAHLLGIVGHDLRTPLTALSASAAMVLRDPALPERHRRALDRVASGAARMSRLIRDLLDYSRARLGEGIPIQRRPCELEPICREALEDVRAAHPDTVFDYCSEGDGSGDWDPDRIEQVVTNLLTNAARYGAPGSPVSLVWRGEAADKRIAVHNDGPPIEKRLVDRMFEPFKRGDAAGSQWGGVGLGLYIVNQIVIAHGGSISVRSEEGHGTTFEIALPASGEGRARG